MQVNASKIKFRRGVNLDRKQVILNSGEPGFTTDTKRLYVGDGTTLGGISAGAKNFLVNSATSTNAEVGDFVFENNIFYCLSGSDYSNPEHWLALSPRVDNSTIKYNSDNKLYVDPSAVTISSVGDGLVIGGSGPEIDLAGDAQTLAFLGFNAGALEVGKLTDISHGGLGYIDTSTATQHHANATTSTPGFMSSADKVKLGTAPTYPIASDADANLLMTGVNRSTATKIDASRLTGAITASSAQYSNEVRRYLGEVGSTVQVLSGHELTTPSFFLNREDFPGTIINSAVPTSYITNQGSFSNISLSGVGTNMSTANYQDKSMLVPSGDGTMYSIFIQTPGDDTALDAYIAAHPELTVVACDYDATQATLISNIVAAVNSIENTKGERVFEAWNDTTNIGDIYIHNLVRGYTTTFNETFSESGGSAIGDAAVTYGNSHNYESKSGSGYSAGDEGSGTISAAMFGWLILNTTTQTFTVNGVAAVHTVANFPTPSAALDGKYLLLYDTNGNRFCVWYDYTGGTAAPTISEVYQHYGYQTIFIEVDISGDATADDLAASTVTALQGNAYFSTVYTVSYSSPTMTFTSVNPGYTDGVVNRRTVGLGSTLTVTPNSTPGTPNVSALQGSFYNAFKVASPSTIPQTSLVIPGKTQQTLVDDNSTTVNVATLLKFR